MKKILIFFFSLILFAEELKISSKYFKYDHIKNISVFEKDVNITKGKDNIVCDKLMLIFKSKKPEKIIALGNVKFIFALDKNSTYKGYTDKLIYNLKSGDIILDGNAFIKKIETNESVKGDYIKINKFTKSIDVKGDKKPINMIIKVN